VPLAKNIETVIPEFYDEKIKCVARWLPKTAHAGYISKFKMALNNVALDDAIMRNYAFLAI